MKKDFRKYHDIELIALVKGKKPDSEAAFSELYDRAAIKLRQFICYMVSNRDQADDIFQETFIYFYNNIRSGKDIDNLTGYLLTIARNLCMKYYRDKKDNIPFDPELLAVDESKKFENNELFELIVNALPLIDDIYREAFILREFEGLSYIEISEIIDSSISNAKSRVFRAHKKLIEILQPYLKDLEKK